MGQDIGNTVTVLVHDLILSSANLYRTTNWRPDLSIIAPGRWVARMPGTGTLRHNSTPARKKAIVGKSRVEATRLQAPIVCLSGFGNDWLQVFSELHGKESLTKANGKLGSRQFPGNRRIGPFFGDVAQDQINQLSGSLIARKMALALSTLRNCMCKLSMALVV